jgi:ATP-binding cassette, subfamily C, bacterial LapB
MSTSAKSVGIEHLLSGSIDPLLACLMLVARAHGGAVSPDALMAGLPSEQQRLTPGLLERAARRAHLSSRLVRQQLVAANDALLPAIALLTGERACVVHAFDEERQNVQVAYPEMGEARVWVPLAKLARDYLGVLAYLRPVQQFDARSPAVRESSQGHWFWRVIAESRTIYRDVLLAALLANVFALGLPLFVMNVYDRVVPNNALDTLWVLAAGLSLMLAGDLALRTLRGWFIDLASARSDVKLSAHIMERVLGMRMEHRPASAGVLAASLRSFESVRDFIGSASVTALVDLPFGLVFIVVIGWIAWPLLIPLALGAGALFLYALLVQRRMRHLSETMYRAGAERNAVLVEALVGLETLKAIGAEAPVQRKWEQSAQLLARTGSQLRLLAASASNGSSFVQQSLNMVIIVLGVYLIAEQSLSVGALMACTMLVSRAMAPIGAAAGLLVQYHTAATALASLNTLMEKEVERPQDKRFLSRGRLAGGIEFRDVSFTYPGQDRPTLRNINLRISPGERVAIIGRVGSGKSTLQKLILGLYRPTGGAVLADGIDVRQLDPAELRRQIGYVEQKVTLFYGSLRENITLGAPLADDAALVQAAQVAGIADMVDTHPAGFDMLVGERGESLSGGQRQGVALARAVVNDPPILLLDEPTSSMDHSTETAVKQKLAAYAQGRTLVIVSHRNSLLEMADRFIVIDNGQVVADGPRNQVIVALRQGQVGRAA